MKEWWEKVVSDYFTFSAGQRNGVMVLSIAILIAAFAPRLTALFQKDKPPNFATFGNEIDSFQKKLPVNFTSDSSLEKPSLAELDETKKERKMPDRSAQLFSFDPNTASTNDFKNLGLGDKLIKTILNYRSKGAKFFAKEDFKKIYGLSSEDYNRLEPYIQITSQQKNSSAPTTKNHSLAASLHAQPSLLDLNRADSVQLVALPGIGPVLSSRILKFRDKLGGFYSVDQLKEVYGMTEDNFVLAKEKISVNVAEVRKISINDVSADDLKQHPYFKPIVVPLINYREQHGNFKSVEELKNIDVITQEVYQKILPYVQI
ncbi:MAG TPA: helix-hairpin-helix domain-containing protein [Chitinophagales bacterium]|nr:helix-hairpin-helix domain-containing protein [Chitinophagales bacterium]